MHNINFFSSGKLNSLSDFFVCWSKVWQYWLDLKECGFFFNCLVKVLSTRNLCFSFPIWFISIFDLRLLLEIDFASFVIFYITYVFFIYLYYNPQIQNMLIHFKCRFYSNFSQFYLIIIQYNLWIVLKHEFCWRVDFDTDDTYCMKVGFYTV